MKSPTYPLPVGWGLDGGNQRICRAVTFESTLRRKKSMLRTEGNLPLSVSRPGYFMCYGKWTSLFRTGDMEHNPSPFKHLPFQPFVTALQDSSLFLVDLLLLFLLRIRAIPVFHPPKHTALTSFGKDVYDPPFQSLICRLRSRTVPTRRRTEELPPLSPLEEG